MSPVVLEGVLASPDPSFMLPVADTAPQAASIEGNCASDIGGKDKVLSTFNQNIARVAEMVPSPTAAAAPRAPTENTIAAANHAHAAPPASAEQRWWVSRQSRKKAQQGGKGMPVRHHDPLPLHEPDRISRVNRRT